MTNDTLYLIQSFLISALSGGNRLSKKDVSDILAKHLNQDPEDLLTDFTKVFNDNVFEGFKPKKGKFGGILLISIAQAQSKLTLLEKPLSSEVVKKLKQKVEEAVKDAAPIIEGKAKGKTSATTEENPSTEETTDPDSTDDSIVGSIVNILPTVRVIAMDSRNWVIQLKAKDGAWISKWYHSTMDSALGSVAQHLLDRKLRRGLTFELNSLVADVKKIQGELLEEIKTSAIEQLKNLGKEKND